MIIARTRSAPGPATLSRRRALGSAALLAVAGLAPAAFAATAVLDRRLRRVLTGLPHLRGAALREDHLIGRVVVVSFFASWCPPCRPEMAHLNRLAAETGAARLTVVGVNLFENFAGRTGDEALNRFLDQMDPDFPILRGDVTAAGAFGGVDRIPTLFVFDRSGRLSTRFVHRRGAAKTHLDLDELRAAVSPLLTG